MSKRILIFDDDVDILSICTYILEEQGWEVHTSQHCNNIDTTVRGIFPDVILMDINMPGYDGIEGLKKLRTKITK